MVKQTIIANGKRMVVKALDEKAKEVLEFAESDEEIFNNIESYGSWEVLSEMEL